MDAVRILSLAAIAMLPAIARAESLPNLECRTLIPRQLPTDRRRGLEPEDLARLRDIGPEAPQDYAAPFFTVSPDGRSAAFQLRQADPSRNKYCLAMVIVDLSGKGQPLTVDAGGEPLIFTFDEFRGIADFPNGTMRVITPRWSPDGRWIAFLKRVDGLTQVWRAFSNGSGSEPMTHAKVDVVDFAISADGSQIIYATRPDIDRQREAIEADGLNGWHFDERFVPFASKRPFPKAPVQREAAVIDVNTGVVRPARRDEASVVATNHEIIAVAGEPAITNGDGLQIAATNLAGGAQPGTFRARRGDGSAALCTASVCEGALYPWRLPHDHVGFFRSEGWAIGSTAIYDWDLSTGKVRRIYSTQDVLTSCAPQRTSLICLVDSSLEPRRLVRLDPASGRRETIFDPNPELAHLTLGKPERLHWRNADGLETMGDLVLPVGYRAGTKYPLIVVQYDTRGFLRGGTGDEYPIQVFANRGYAVLSFSHPHFPSDKLGAKNFEQAGRIDLQHFVYRRNLASALEAGVRLAIARGVADPKRIGITGLSDGSSTVEWELIHTSMFSAAALSSCCWSPSFVSLVGPSAAKHFLYEGYPGILGHDDPFWKNISAEINARHLSTPTLVNAAEGEFPLALETYTALREAGVAVDMFVFPGEYHVRWQPAHRLATYRRSLDWFDYWLRGIRSNAADRRSELEEWDRLRIAAGHGQPI